MHLIFHWTGLTNAAGKTYLFWSGICGDLVFLGAAVTLFRKHNCHVAGCYRIGKHPVQGTPYITCRKHHPTTPDKVHHEHVLRAHKKANDG